MSSDAAEDTPRFNAPEGPKVPPPKQAIAPTPDLYEELVADCFVNLAKTSLTFGPPLADGSLVHDNGCGTGAASEAVMAAVGQSVKVSIKATDVDARARSILQKKAEAHSWSIDIEEGNALELKGIHDHEFDLSITNGVLFTLPLTRIQGRPSNEVRAEEEREGEIYANAIKAVNEIHRTLKPGGTAIINTWKYVPNLEPVQTASRETRPPGTKVPRDGFDVWSDAEFLERIIRKGGFEKIAMHECPVSTTVLEMKRYVAMLWSCVGGAGADSWLASDEENWDLALDVVERQLRKTPGFRELPDGRLHLEFVANIAIATK
ncbi:S-adenosyl-L-methionine-dependent methyltransferase [Xylariaceae sp. FL1019]|nr:S-adenosyl-L-methionine-dependent methyltransferase [Xylariaceae sp. FL1019]